MWLTLQAGGKAGKDTGKAKAKAVSRSARAGLQVKTKLAWTVKLTMTVNYGSILWFIFQASNE